MNHQIKASTAALLLSLLSPGLAFAEPPECPCWGMVEKLNSGGQVMLRTDAEQSPIMDLFVGKVNDPKSYHLEAVGDYTCDFASQGTHWIKAVKVSDDNTLVVTHNKDEFSCKAKNIYKINLTEMQTIGCAQELNEVFGVKEDGSYSTQDKCFSSVSPQ